MTVVVLTSMGTLIVTGVIWRLARLRTWIITRVVFVAYLLAIVLCATHVIALPAVTWAGGILLVIGAFNAIADFAGPPDPV